MRESSLCLALAGVAVFSAAPRSVGQPAARLTAPERRTVSAFNTARDGGSSALRAFIDQMPKGADLHMHLSGAIYAETFLKDAVEDHLCIDLARRSFVKNLGLTASQPPQPTCPENTVPAATAFRDQKVFDALVDSFSMRAFVASSGISGHDQFFATFDRFGGLNKSHSGEWLDEVATRAAAQNEQYLEVMMTPVFAKAAALGSQIGWPTELGLSSLGDTSTAGIPDPTPAQLAMLRDKLLAGGLRDEIATDRAQVDGDLAARGRLEHCGEPTALPACGVEIRILYQVLRAFPPQQVFAQTLLAFEVAAADPNVVGLNFVQPEDAYMAMAEYHRQMLMLDFLHGLYPRVHVSLHAGELAPGLVPPAGLRFHIREAVELGHAERIGHGVDVMLEDKPQLLLKELADRHTMIEVNLTSNDVILGISTNRHSLPDYLRAHVPIAFSTDDEGVSRINLTHEYTRAALDFKLGYLDLKRSARTSLEHTFLPGPSLWQQPDQFTRGVAACSRQVLGADMPNPGCSDFLKASPHAAQQWELERRFRQFEATF